MHDERSIETMACSLLWGPCVLKVAVGYSTFVKDQIIV